MSENENYFSNIKEGLSPLDIPTRSEITRKKAYSLIIFVTILSVIVGIAILSINLGHAIAMSAEDLPDVRLLENHKPSETTLIFDINDNLVANIHGDEDRVVVPLEKISKNIQKAVLSTEDDMFYEHHGINLKGIFRAFLINFKSGDSKQGGSTVTQQLVKNLFLTPERTLQRKIAEAILAVRVENMYDKKQILELYLNQVYWGNRSYGIEKAAKRYFKISAKDLNLAQSSLLAGLLKAPSDYSPYTNFDRAKERQKIVLDKMLKDGFITEKQYETAVNYKFNFAPSIEQTSKYPYFVTYVISELEKTYGKDVVRRGGLRVYTTLNPAIQKIGEDVLNKTIKSMPAYTKVKQGAIVSIDVDNGYISCIVGGTDFDKSNFNRATQSKRALGSSFKPIVYLTGFRKGVITPDTVIQDAPITLSDGWTSWSPHNWDNKYLGTMTVRKALYLSRNTPTVRVASKVGPDSIIETARLLGIKSHIDRNLSIALGSSGIPPIELATAFTTIARGGVYIEPIVVRRIEDSQGKVLEINEPHPVKVIDSNSISILTSILIDVVNKGTGRSAILPDRVVAGKTGTSDEIRDIWFTGFTPDTVTTVWMGNDENKPLKGVFSSNCAKAWKEFSTKYYAELKIPPRQFKEPSKVVTKKIDPLTGLLANPDTPNAVEKQFQPGTEPKKHAPSTNVNKAVVPKLDTSGMSSPVIDTKPNAPAPDEIN
ncbi:MAG: PBP1A family penicillin-binding protein [Cyanobacteriota bacterium]